MGEEEEVLVSQGGDLLTWDDLSNVMVYVSASV